jgi:uncharacterized membrane protein
MSTPPSMPDPRSLANASVESHTSAMARLRRYFLTGLVVAGPLAVTAAVTWWFINLIDGWVTPFIPNAYLPQAYLPFRIPGFGLVVGVIGLTMLGFLTANLVGRYLVDFGDRILGRTPLIKGIYKSVKQLFETVFSQSGTSFRKAGLVEFPAKGMWSVVFLSQDAMGDIAERIPSKEDQIGVFLPCTPNPTTGFFFYLPRSEVIELSIPVEDAAKLIMSAGLIQPEEQQKKLADLAVKSSIQP